MRILLTTYGSLGDLHPCIALALALKARGHDAAIATNPNYRDNIECESIRFHTIRPHFDDYGSQKEWLSKALGNGSPTNYLIRNLIFPYLDQVYEDLKAVAPNYDAVVAHPLVYPAPIVCEELKIPWISMMLQPLALFSSYDPPLLPSLPYGQILKRFGPGPVRWHYKRMKAGSWKQAEQIDGLRAKAGLRPAALHPMYDGLASPLLNLCLFSSILGSPQRDWPQSSRLTGFLFYDKPADRRLDPDVERFLDDGPPPIVFTLGSSVSYLPGNFYAESAKAAASIGRRALLLTMGDTGFDPETRLPDGVKAFPYAPYSMIFPRAAAVVHQGGAGTTAVALRAGKPQVFVPVAHDQPDNARRMQAGGIGRSICRSKYCAALAAKELSRVLDDTSIARAAGEAREQILCEEGANNACLAIENALAQPSPRQAIAA